MLIFSFPFVLQKLAWVKISYLTLYHIASEKAMFSEKNPFFDICC